MTFSNTLYILEIISAICKYVYICFIVSYMFVLYISLKMVSLDRQNIDILKSAVVVIFFHCKLCLVCYKHHSNTKGLLANQEHINVYTR